MAGEDEKGHFGDAELDDLHLVAASTARDAGACLTGHLADFKERKNQESCNYRWQCYVGKNAVDRLHSYPTDAKQKVRVRTDFKVTNAMDWLSKYCFYLPRPQPGDWHIGGPNRNITRRTFLGDTVTIPQGDNFTSALWPYFNNAHHIIPKGTLRAMIAEQGADLSNIIQKALLKAKYNVNHKINVVFLPMDRAVGSILRLPRHLERRALKSHPVYDGYVRGEQKYQDETASGLSKVMDHYSEIAKKAKDAADPKKHAIPDAEMSKRKLENLSKDLLEIILEWGESGTGDSLDTEAQTAEETLAAAGG
jgi:A nuclease family of the HNH/ENDO VII superfamily with conserved AHH